MSVIFHCFIGDILQIEDLTIPSSWLFMILFSEKYHLRLWDRHWPSGSALAEAGYNTLQASIQVSSAWSPSLTLNAATPAALLGTPAHPPTHTHIHKYRRRCRHTKWRYNQKKAKNKNNISFIHIQYDTCLLILITNEFQTMNYKSDNFMTVWSLADMIMLLIHIVYNTLCQPTINTFKLLIRI